MPFTDGDKVTDVPGAFVGGADITAGVGTVVPAKSK